MNFWESIVYETYLAISLMNSTITLQLNALNKSSSKQQLNFIRCEAKRILNSQSARAPLFKVRDKAHKTGAINLGLVAI
jgi:hypothetical protein